MLAIFGADVSTGWVISTFISYFGEFLVAAIIIRILMSWFALSGALAGGPVIRLLDDITEPILGPLRRSLPTLGMIDISPIVAIILIQFITGLLASNIR
jgi:YggT family protein